MKFKTLASGISLSLMMFMGAGVALAEELPEDTVISKDNYEQIKDKTYEGHKIQDLLPERWQWAVKERGMVIPLRHSEPVPMDKKYMDCTQESRKNVKFDPATREVTGWKCGMFFDPQDIKMDDPAAGDKLIWNLRAATYGATMDLRDICWVFISGDTGVERVQRWWARRFYMEGRLENGTPMSFDKEGNPDPNPTIMQKTVLVAIAPQDIKGIGIFSIRYNDPSAKTPDDTWAYLRAVRRDRRLTGNAWMDPIGGTDQLYDDWDIWDAVPTKYKKNTLLGKRWILAITHADPVTVDLSKATVPEQFPSVGLTQPPYFFPDRHVKWEPREVWVIEGICPDEHPYSRKIVYMEKDYPRPYLGEAYDHNNVFWKMFIFQNRRDVGDDGYLATMPVVGHIIDFKKNHATNWSSNMKANPKGVGPNDVSLKRLIELAQ